MYKFTSWCVQEDTQECVYEFVQVVVISFAGIDKPKPINDGYYNLAEKSPNIALSNFTIPIFCTFFRH